jgi:hypothetical protein
VAVTLNYLSFTVFADTRRKPFVKRAGDICFQTITPLHLQSYRMDIQRDDPFKTEMVIMEQKIYCKLFRLNCWLTQYTTQFDVETAINIASLLHSVCLAPLLYSDTENR